MGSNLLNSNAELYLSAKEDVFNTAGMNRNKLETAVLRFQGGSSFKKHYSGPEYRTIVDTIDRLNTLQAKFNINDRQVTKIKNKELKTSKEKDVTCQPQSSALDCDKVNKRCRNNNKTTQLTEAAVSKDFMIIVNGESEELQSEQQEKINKVKAKLAEKKLLQKQQQQELEQVREHPEVIETNQVQGSLVQENFAGRHPIEEIMQKNQQQVQELQTREHAHDPTPPFSLWNVSNFNLIDSIIGNQQKAKRVVPINDHEDESSNMVRGEKEVEVFDTHDRICSKTSLSADSPRASDELSSRRSSQESHDDHARNNNVIDEILHRLFPLQTEYEKFANLFQTEELDYDSFILLSEQDLHQLGVKMGPRKKLLKEIRELQISRT